MTKKSRYKKFETSAIFDEFFIISQNIILLLKRLKKLSYFLLLINFNRSDFKENFSNTSCAVNAMFLCI